MHTGTCIRGTKGDLLSAVSWIEGEEVFVRVMISDPSGDCKPILLSGGNALLLADELRLIVPNSELI